MTTKDIVLMALFAALTAALGLFPSITIPMIAVPITAQTLGPMLAGSILGARRGGLSIVLFVVLVLAGLPLLAGGRGGLAVLFGPTAGFLLAWPFAAALIGWLHERTPPGFAVSILANVAGGIVLIYAVGIPWLSVAANLPLAKAAIGSAAFIPGDVVKVLLAAVIADTVRRTAPAAAPALRD